MAAVFCGSRTGKDPAFAEGAKALGAELVSRNIGLVYGGGTIGLMGIVAHAVADAKGDVLGVIPNALINSEAVGTMVGRPIYVETMHERKEIMYKNADCFIAMPGGFGTLDELLEITTWMQLGIHNKPVGILNIAGYFDGLLSWIENARAQQFISEDNAKMIVVSNDPKDLLDKLQRSEPKEPWFKWNIKI
eukprot:TRINITY_DN10333_c0_g1_i1.p1 TRINITY_DN10333_c0_g1~~TRINITY_DN10333_c0_g1_i1.p1  ORF type:complete len:203 (+),score=31.62 TRINITY_DN10333_c0_g1_i1:38-610(+)